MFKTLIVDDSEIVCKQLKRLKIWGEPSGFVIAGEASDGELALQRLRSERFDLVITDIRMPKIGGVELLIQVAKEKLAPCVVFMSGFSEFEYAKQGLVYGAFDYLVKPVRQEDIGQLLQRVRERLLRRQREAENVSRAIRAAASWMPDEEINQITTNMQCEPDKLLTIAETLVDRVEGFCGKDSSRRGFLLTDVLRKIGSLILTEKPWMDSYVDLPGLIEQLGRKPGYYFVDRAVFLETLKDVVALTNQFSPCYEKGKIVRDATLYILTHIDEGIAVHDIAAALFLNRTYLSEVFKEKTESAVSEYLTAMKMARARRLLINSDLRTSDIAKRLGYRDVNYFSRQFRQEHGMSTEEYRLSRLKDS